MLRRRHARALMGRVSRPVLQLWFEFASTYSYPAVQRIEAKLPGRPRRRRVSAPRRSGRSPSASSARREPWSATSSSGATIGSRTRSRGQPVARAIGVDRPDRHPRCRGLAGASDDGIRAGMGLLDLLGGGAPGIGVGDPAPDFALPDRSGRTVRLGDYRGKKAVVLYFYPKDDTPGCTKEACSFRDQYQDFQDAGAEVIGVSSDAEASHEKFAAKYRLPFVLLADRSGAVRTQYGVPATLGLLPGRVTFVIDKQGIVRHVLHSQLRPNRHCEEAIAALRAMGGA